MATASNRKVQVGHQTASETGSVPTKRKAFSSQVGGKKWSPYLKKIITFLIFV
jgi:hypothetical protein